jgi:hypothetical protein
MPYNLNFLRNLTIPFEIASVFTVHIAGKALQRSL